MSELLQAQAQLAKLKETHEKKIKVIVDRRASYLEKYDRTRDKKYLTQYNRNATLRAKLEIKYDAEINLLEEKINNLTIAVEHMDVENFEYNIDNFDGFQAVPSYLRETFNIAVHPEYLKVYDQDFEEEENLLRSFVKLYDALSNSVSLLESSKLVSSVLANAADFRLKLNIFHDNRVKYARQYMIDSGLVKFQDSNTTFYDKINSFTLNNNIYVQNVYLINLSNNILNLRGIEYKNLAIDYDNNGTNWAFKATGTRDVGQPPANSYMIIPQLYDSNFITVGEISYDLHNNTELREIYDIGYIETYEQLTDGVQKTYPFYRHGQDKVIFKIREIGLKNVKNYSYYKNIGNNDKVYTSYPYFNKGYIYHSNDTTDYRLDDVSYEFFKQFEGYVMGANSYALHTFNTNYSVLDESFAANKKLTIVSDMLFAALIGLNNTRDENGHLTNELKYNSEIGAQGSGLDYSLIVVESVQIIRPGKTDEQIKKLVEAQTKKKVYDSKPYKIVNYLVNNDYKPELAEYGYCVAEALIDQIINSTAIFKNTKPNSDFVFDLLNGSIEYTTEKWHYNIKSSNWLLQITNTFANRFVPKELSKRVIGYDIDNNLKCALVYLGVRCKILDSTGNNVIYTFDPLEEHSPGVAGGQRCCFIGILSNDHLYTIDTHAKNILKSHYLFDYTVSDSANLSAQIDGFNNYSIWDDTNLVDRKVMDELQESNFITSKELLELINAYELKNTKLKSSYCMENLDIILPDLLKMRYLPDISSTSSGNLKNINIQIGKNIIKLINRGKDESNVINDFSEIAKIFANERTLSHFNEDSNAFLLSGKKSMINKLFENQYYPVYSCLNEVDEFDYQKMHMDALAQIERIPVCCVFDQPEEYDGHCELSSGFEASSDIQYMFEVTEVPISHKNIILLSKNTMFGNYLNYIHALGCKFKIYYYLIFSQIIDIIPENVILKLRNYFNKYANRDKSEQSDKLENLAKLTANKFAGTLGMHIKSTQTTRYYTSLEDVECCKTSYIPSTLIVDDKIFYSRTTKSRSIYKSGYLPIYNKIITNTACELLKMYDIILINNATPIYCVTDGITIVKGGLDNYKIPNHSFLEKWNGLEFVPAGKYKLKQKDRPLTKYLNCTNNTFDKKQFTGNKLVIFKNLNKIDINLDDLSESSTIEKMSKLTNPMALCAKYPGGGKSTFTLENFPKESTLFITPTLQTRDDIINHKTYPHDALTLLSLFSMTIKREERDRCIATRIINGSSLDRKEYKNIIKYCDIVKTIIFDEVAFYGLGDLSLIYNFVNCLNPNIQIIYCFDERQFKPVNQRLNALLDFNTLYRSIIIGCLARGNVMTFSTVKRSVNEDARVKMEKFCDFIAKCTISDKRLLFEELRKFGIKRLSEMPECEKSRPQYHINYTISSKTYNEKLIKNTMITCKRNSIDLGFKRGTNYRFCAKYTIYDNGKTEDVYVIRRSDGSRFALSSRELNNLFNGVNSSTSHSIQGISIEEEKNIIIHDYTYKHVNNRWLFVSITRARNINNVYFDY
jgi:hypothetical protein